MDDIEERKLILEQTKKWIEIAQRDYDVAINLYENIYPTPIEAICYNSQQSIEKSLKSILVFNDKDVPKIHDIERLAKLTTSYISEISAVMPLKIADVISDFATESRYPDFTMEFTLEDAKLGLKYSKRILELVAEKLNVYSTEIFPAKDKSQEVFIFQDISNAKAHIEIVEKLSTGNEKDVHRIALNGTLFSGLKRFLSENKDVNSLVACFSNSISGENLTANFVREFENTGYKLSQSRPKEGKDFIEDLDKIKEQVKQLSKDQQNDLEENDWQLGDD